jgi:hypothetical protein
MVLFLSKLVEPRILHVWTTYATNFWKYKSKHSLDKKKVLAAHNIDMANHRIDNSPFEIKLADNVYSWNFTSDIVHRKSKKRRMVSVKPQDRITGLSNV